MTHANQPEGNPIRLPQAPPATRRQRPGWRDPRLAAGVALVALSTIIGARIVSAADDTVGVWAMAESSQRGDAVTEEDLVRRQVRFADQELADRYLPASADLPDDAALSRSLGEGELLPRDAVTETSRVNLMEVPMSVQEGSLPPGLRAGAEVDVWLVPVDSAAGRDTDARRVLEDVVVLAVGGEAGEFSVSGERHLLVGVPATAEQKVADFLGALAGSRVVVTRKS